jgi:hypothetical protein
MTVLLTHPYTWDVLMAVLVFFLAWTFLKRKSEGKLGVGLLAFVLAANLVFYTPIPWRPSGRV